MTPVQHPVLPAYLGVLGGSDVGSLPKWLFQRAGWAGGYFLGLQFLGFKFLEPLVSYIVCAISALIV